MRKIRLIVLSLVISLSLLSFCSNKSFATTITNWSTAQTDYPGSTAGNVGDPAGGIVWSRHNLSSYGWPLQPAVATGSWPALSFAPVTTEICVFCHTPHFARTDTAPLWNRGSAALAYVAYGTTLAGTSISSISGSSLACLSCHDGVTTFDTLINRPGKGSNTTGTGADQGWGFLMIETTFGLEHFSKTACGTCHPQDESDRLNIGDGPNFNYSTKTVDLTNDHPINVAYQPDRASLRPTSTVISSIDMKQARSFNDDTTQDGYGRSDNLWSVKGYISDTATIDDILRDGGKVQCTSCHDPHYKNQTNNDPAFVDSYDRTGGGTGYNYDVTSQFDGVIDGLFLRRVGGNSNSGICRTCHNK
jgi:hypothetical protein